MDRGGDDPRGGGAVGVDEADGEGDGAPALPQPVDARAARDDRALDRRQLALEERPVEADAGDPVHGQADQRRGGGEVHLVRAGDVLDASPWPINPAGYTLHSTIHGGIDAAHCVMHTHTTAGVAVASLQGGLSQSNFYSAQLHDMVAYHPFEGITIHAEEGPRVLASMGSKPAIILRNHGLLSWGRDIGEAFMWLWTLQRACDVQVAASAAGPLHAVSDQARAQCVREAGPLEPAVCAAVYAALVRRLDQAGARYAD